MIFSFSKYNKTFELNVTHIVQISITDDQLHCEVETVNGNSYHFKDSEAAYIWQQWQQHIKPALGGDLPPPS